MNSSVDELLYRKICTEFTPFFNLNCNFAISVEYMLHYSRNMLIFPGSERMWENVIDIKRYTTDPKST